MIPTPAVGIKGLKPASSADYNTTSQIPTPAVGIKGLKPVRLFCRIVTASQIPTPAVGIKGLKLQVPLFGLNSN